MPGESADGVPEPAIDIGAALDLLDSSVRERGQGYCSAATEGIVTLALRKAGVPGPALGPLAHASVSDLYTAGRLPLNMTLGAVVVLRAAESADRIGQPWAMAMAAALRAAARFLELLPRDLERAFAGASRTSEPRGI
jgi:hypothetical protein